MKPLIAILTCHKFKFRADNQRQFWARQDQGFDIRFFLGLGSDRAPGPDEIFLPVRDDYRSMPAKHRAMCEWSDRSGYEHTLRSDDDSYIVLDRLLASGFEAHDYSGRLRSPSGRYPHQFCSGIGYWLSRRACQIVAAAPLPQDHVDDRWVGNLLYAAGIRCHADYRYGVSKSSRNFVSLSEGPRAGNEIICSGEYQSRHEMEKVHQEYLSIRSDGAKLDETLTTFKNRCVKKLGGVKVKTFNIVTALNNGAGLQKDFELLKKIIEDCGHRAVGVPFQSGYIGPSVNVNIFLEVLVPNMLHKAEKNWIVPNSEWWYSRPWDRYLSKVSRVLCKTRDCYRIWSARMPAHSVFIGWESRDLYDQTIVREPHFLHMAGKSETKNTAAVAEAWRKHKIPYPLTAVAFKPCIVSLCKGIPNVTHVERLTDEDVARYINRFRFHIMPSKYEGFGHYIHEAIGCGGIVVTTDAPPMNAFAGIDREMLIPVDHTEPRLAAVFNYVTPDAIAEAVHKAAALDQARLEEIHQAGRKAFLSDREFFREQILEVIRHA